MVNGAFRFYLHSKALHSPWQRKPKMTDVSLGAVLGFGVIIITLHLIRGNGLHPADCYPSGQTSHEHRGGAVRG